MTFLMSVVVMMMMMMMIMVSIIYFNTVMSCLELMPLDLWPCYHRWVYGSAQSLCSPHPPARWLPKCHILGGEYCPQNVTLRRSCVRIAATGRPIRERATLVGDVSSSGDDAHLTVFLPPIVNVVCFISSLST